jgi:hypothetical protein
MADLTVLELLRAGIWGVTGVIPVFLAAASGAARYDKTTPGGADAVWLLLAFIAQLAFGVAAYMAGHRS